MDEKEKKRKQNYKTEIYLTCVFSFIFVFCTLGWQILAAAVPKIQAVWLFGFPLQYTMMFILSVPGLLVMWLIYAKLANENDEEREALESSQD